MPPKDSVVEVSLGIASHPFHGDCTEALGLPPIGMRIEECHPYRLPTRRSVSQSNSRIARRQLKATRSRCGLVRTPPLQSEYHYATLRFNPSPAGGNLWQLLPSKTTSPSLSASSPIGRKRPSSSRKQARTTTPTGSAATSPRYATRQTSPGPIPHGSSSACETRPARS